MHGHYCHTKTTLVSIYSADGEDGMLVLQALVEGTVLEAHPTGHKSSDPDQIPFIELYIPSHHASEVSSQCDHCCIIITSLCFRDKLLSIENLLTRALLHGVKH